MTFKASIVSIKNLAFVWLLAQCVCEASAASALPEQVSVGVGLNVRTREIYSQESYLQDSLMFSLAGHWNVFPWPADMIGRASYEKFYDLPRAPEQINVVPQEHRVAIDLGIENKTYVPVGVSVGVARVSKVSRLSVGDFVVNESGGTAWSENQTVPIVRSWFGVPVFPNVLQMSLGIQRVLVSRPVAEVLSYSSELRFEF